MTTLAPSFFDWFFFILVGNEDKLNIMDGIVIRQDPTRDL